MRRRAERLNGTLDIKSGLDEGTRVTITAPVPPRFILDDWLSRNEK
jgi:nitrate/nitrite-specific signal transduction histidine kinase